MVDATVLNTVSLRGVPVQVRLEVPKNSGRMYCLAGEKHGIVDIAISTDWGKSPYDIKELWG